MLSKKLLLKQGLWLLIWFPTLTNVIRSRTSYIILFGLALEF